MAENYVKIIGEASGAKAQNVEWFSADLQEQQVSEQFGASKFRLTLAISSEVAVQVTLDSGTTWVYLNASDAIKADSLYMFDVGVRQGDNFNMRTDDSSGTTVRFCRVSEVSMEG
jgi:hypothetical protein